MIVRHLGHDGLWYYFTGTSTVGELLWSDDPDHAFAFSTESSAQRIAQKAAADGLTVEITL